jgi:hypothetical protein
MIRRCGFVLAVLAMLSAAAVADAQTGREPVFAGVGWGAISAPSDGRTDFAAVDSHDASPAVFEGGAPIYKRLGAAVEWRSLGTVQVMDRYGPTLYTKESETEHLLLFGVRVRILGANRLALVATGYAGRLSQAFEKTDGFISFENTQVIRSRVSASGSSPLVAVGVEVPVALVPHVQAVGACKAIRIVRDIPAISSANGWHAAISVGVRTTW